MLAMHVLINPRNLSVWQEKKDRYMTGRVTRSGRPGDCKTYLLLYGQPIH